MGPITKRALEILEQFPIHKEQPASISGKYHSGETCREHIEIAARLMEDLCREFNIQGEDKDMLIAATYLHDIGNYIITHKGEITQEGWKYWKETGFSQCRALAMIHPIIGAKLLDDFDIARKAEIQRLISVHMSHWYPNNPQPQTFYERLICTADYIASRDWIKFDMKKPD